MLIHRQLTPAIIQRSYRQLIPFSIFEFQNVAQGIYEALQALQGSTPPHSHDEAPGVQELPRPGPRHKHVPMTCASFNSVSTSPLLDALPGVRVIGPASLLAPRAGSVSAETFLVHLF